MSRAVVRRVIQYLAYLEELRDEGVQWVSSAEIGEALDLTSAIVRRDLLPVDFSGITNRGYEVKGLSEQLTAFLGVDRTWNSAIAGAGNLGKALALHGEWLRRGFKICAVFDTDRRKIGTRVGDLVIQSLEEMPEAISQKQIEIGVLAVPTGAAQSVADLMIAAGIRGILNLALTHIVAPSALPVIDGRLIGNMMELAHNIRTVSATEVSRERVSC